MSRYRWVWIRNRACALFAVVALLAVIVGLVQLAGWLAGGRAPYVMILASVLTLAVLLGLDRWRWFRELSDRMQGEERRAWLDRSGVQL